MTERTRYGTLWGEPLSEDSLSLLSYMPIGKGDDGRYGVGVPGAIQGAMRSTQDALTLPQRVMAGHNPSIADAMNMAGAVAVGSAGAPVPRGALRVFGGPGAETADMAKLRKAQLLHEYGTPAEVIWKDTGWFQDTDSKWKFEIPDTGAKWKGIATEPKVQQDPLKYDAQKQGWLTSTGWGDNPARLDIPLFAEHKLGDVLDHPALFEAYPHLKDTPVRSTGFDLNSSGSYDPGDKTIRLGYDHPEAALSTNLHEIQHGIQHYEGFAAGGNTGQFLPADYKSRKQFLDTELESWNDRFKELGVNKYNIASGLDSQRKKLAIPQYIQDEMDKLTPAEISKYQELLKEGMTLASQNNLAYEKYKMLGGEVEARNVQERATQGAYDVFPHATEGYPQGHQIIKYGDPYNSPEAIKQLLTGGSK